MIICLSAQKRVSAFVFLLLLSAGAICATAKEAFVPALLTIEAPGLTNVLLLKGAEARRQLLVTAIDAAGGIRDLSSKATFEVSPAGIVRVEKGGLVIPLAAGEATLKVKDAS